MGTKQGRRTVPSPSFIAANFWFCSLLLKVIDVNSQYYTVNPKSGLLYSTVPAYSVGQHIFPQHLSEYNAWISRGGQNT